MSKRTNPAERLARKRTLWLERTAAALGISQPAARERLSIDRRQGVRLNPLIARPSETLAQLTAIGWRGVPYPWAEHCYSTLEGAASVRDSALVAAGAAYVQNAASWLPVVVLGPQAGDRILDVCAAPGGKASHIAAITGNQARLWVNDNSRARLLKMQANFKRLGVIPEDMTLFDAGQLSRKLEGRTFDAILLDAPCSGEGLMHYGRDKDVAMWSVAHIKRLQQLQKRLIFQAWQLLDPGGTLVYSTCTMAPEENEAVIDYLLRTQADAHVEAITLELPNRAATVKPWNGRPYNAAVQGCLRLAPSPDIEAFFVAKLLKAAGNTGGNAAAPWLHQPPVAPEV